jgi:DNA-binding HxlR family transcriptional regulator
MDGLFAALGHPLRLWIVVRLIQEPLRQNDLRKEMEAAGITGGPINPGTMTYLLRPLLAQGLLVRDHARAPLRVAHRTHVERLLATAAACQLAVSGAALDAAQSQHARLLRDLITLAAPTHATTDGLRQPQRPDLDSNQGPSP